MPNSRSLPDAARLWADVETRCVPRFQLHPTVRVAYFHLLRLSRLAGLAELRITIPQLARSVWLNRWTVRHALATLHRFGLIRILERGRSGLRLRVFLPAEIPGCPRSYSRAPRASESSSAPSFYRVPALRSSIYERDRHRCFYCSRPLSIRNRVLDHVVPRTRGGDDSYRNLVACCLDCSSLKSNRSAAQFLSAQFRRGAISRAALRRLRATLAALRAGRLRPDLSSLPCVPPIP